MLPSRCGWVCLVLLLGCGGSDDGEAVGDDEWGDADADTDADSDLDSDTDSDADSDADTDMDSDTDWGDADSDTDSDTDSDADSDSDSDTDSDADVCDFAREEANLLYMSADDSNSQADATWVRQMIESGDSILDPLRLYEFLNYYTFDYEPADPGTLRVVPQLAPVEGDDGGYSMLVGVVSPHVAPAERWPLALTFSVDTSTSMNGHAIARAKDVMRAIAGELRVRDVVSIVSWNTDATIVLDSLAVSGRDDTELLDVIDDLSTDGSTNFSEGLETAYDLALDNYSEVALNRVVVISDGGANTGPTDEDLIAENAFYGEDLGIFLVGIGADDNPSSYEDLLMDTVTDRGKGAYLYVDSAEEAERAFTGEKFLANLDLYARDVRLEVTFPGGWVIDEFHGEEVSEDPAEVEPQHLAPNDAMLWHMELRDCAAADHDGTETFTFGVTWTDAAGTDVREEVTLSVAEMLAGRDLELRKADAIVAYAKALTEVRALPAVERRAHLDAVWDQVDDAFRTLPGDWELVEILDLLDTYRDGF